MMSSSIPGIHSRGNQYYSTLPNSFSLSPCHTSILLQQAEPVFFLWTSGTSGTSGQYVPTGCWHTTGVTLGALFPPLASRRRRYSCS